MNLFDALNRWTWWARRNEGDAQARPHRLRPEVLRQPDPDERVLDRIRGKMDDTVDRPNTVRGDGLATDAAQERYRARPSWEGGGPRWDPYDAEQSRAARVQSRRRAQARSRDGAVRDRASQPSQPSHRITHYQVLGVPPHASMEQIEGAYRRYAAAIHPDKFFDDPVARGEAERKLRELNAIMQVLRDPVQRAIYDTSL